MRLKSVLAAGAAVALLAPAAAFAAPGDWGQAVKDCVDNAGCYDGGSRGSYVSVQAQDADSPGYAWELNNLAPPPPGDAAQGVPFNGS